MTEKINDTGTAQENPNPIIFNVLRFTYKRVDENSFAKYKYRER